MFTFKHFAVNDAHCAMKVGTDGVLLGAWANVSCARRVLDIGCGSGVIALMAAQRNASALVTGVEIDPSAAGDARANALSSPFAERVRIVCGDILSLKKELPPSDCILANPPYHEETLLPPTSLRATARHTDGGGLTFAALLCAVDSLLYKGEEKTYGGETESGETMPAARFSLILPTQAVPHFEGMAAAHGLYASRRTTVVTRQGKPSKRTLLELSRHAVMPVCDTLVLLSPDGSRSPQYAGLCRDFYIK